MSVISAGNTTSTAFKVTADTNADLVFTTGGSNATALTLSNTQAATFAGNVSVTNIIANNGLIINNANVSSYVIASGFNAMSTGPVTVPAGQVVNVSSNARWVVL